MPLKLFVTSTDTDMGKTYIVNGLLRARTANHHSTLGVKPVAAGGRLVDGEWVNEDVAMLREAASIKLPYATINPFFMRQFIAPHIGAEQEGINLSVAKILPALQPALQQTADLMVVEGAGGWLVPLNQEETMADLAKALNFPVLLVVGIRLGCINHALLTYQAIQATGLPLYGWIANCPSPEVLAKNEIIATIKQRVAAPCLGVVDFQAIVGECVNLD